MKYSVSSSFVVAPGEVRVRLREAELRQVLHHLGRVNASDRKITSGYFALDLGDQPLPERERLGVRVVDAEDAHALLDPEQEDALQLLPQRPASPRVSKSNG